MSAPIPPRPRDAKGRFLAGYTLWTRYDGAKRWLRFFGGPHD